MESILHIINAIVITLQMYVSHLYSPALVTLSPLPDSRNSIRISSVRSLVASQSSDWLYMNDNTSTVKFGIILQTLDGTILFEHNAHVSFESASLYKLWVMATTFDAIQKGALTLETQISESVESLNTSFRIDEEYAELTDGVISLTTKEALEKMITRSDNYAALLLTKKIRLSRVRYFLEKHGFKESSVGTDGSSPRTSAFDVSKFFLLLSNGALANEQFTKNMIELLTNQSLNEKIPAHIEKDIQIAHKTGELGEVSHDAGIIYAKNPYILSILSQGLDVRDANNTIAGISKDIYDIVDSYQ